MNKGTDHYDVPRVTNFHKLIILLLYGPTKTWKKKKIVGDATFQTVWYVIVGRYRRHGHFGGFYTIL